MADLFLWLRQGTQGGEAIQFGAARDSQTAADTAALSGHVSTGAATFSFIQAIERAGTNISYGRLLQVCGSSLGRLGVTGSADVGRAAVMHWVWQRPWGHWWDYRAGAWWWSRGCEAVLHMHVFMADCTQRLW